MQIEYFGKNYSGWQKQAHSPSVQEELEKALSKVANHTVEVTCAGRTDSGVHATSQIVNFFSDSDRTLSSWQKGTNAFLSDDIKVVSIREVDESFNARFTAISRTYNYVIYKSQVRSPIFGDYSLLENRPLDIQKMNEAAKYFLGENNFTSFRSSKCQANTPFRFIEKAEFIERDNFIIFEVIGNAFLHNMIRNFIGSLFKVGLGFKDPIWIKEVLDAKDRCKAGVTAKPHGLFFVGVKYPDFEYRRDVSGFFS